MHKLWLLDTQCSGLTVLIHQVCSYDVLNCADPFSFFSVCDKGCKSCWKVKPQGVPLSSHMSFQSLVCVRVCVSISVHVHMLNLHSSTESTHQLLSHPFLIHDPSCRPPLSCSVDPRCIPRGVSLALGLCKLLSRPVRRRHHQHPLEDGPEKLMRMLRAGSSARAPNITHNVTRHTCVLENVKIWTFHLSPCLLCPLVRTCEGLQIASTSEHAKVLRSDISASDMTKKQAIFIARPVAVQF